MDVEGGEMIEMRSGTSRIAVSGLEHFQSSRNAGRDSRGSEIAKKRDELAACSGECEKRRLWEFVCKTVSAVLTSWESAIDLRSSSFETVHQSPSLCTQIREQSEK